MLFLPDADLSGLAAKDTLNGVASKDRQALALVAAGTPARIVFGRDRLGAHIDNVLSHGAHVLIRALWCWAPGGLGIDAIEAVHFDDDIVPPGVERTDYLGTAGQGIDPWLAAAFAAQGITYADTLPGMAYTVFKVPRLLASSIGVPSIAAIIRGSKLPDPRTGTSAYTANPALALAAFLSADWGMGRTVDASSVQAAANACDALVGGRPRRAFGLTLGSVQRVDSWVDTLRTYAGCWVVPGHAGLRLVPDRPASVVATIDHAAGQILRLGALTKRSPTQAPTLVRVQYTDTALVPWRTEAYAEAALPGVSGGTTPRRESVVRLEGIQNYAQALREATERLNKLTLTDLSCEVQAFDDALRHQPGDVIALSHPIGLAAKPMRIMTSQGEHGRYTLTLSEYDPAVYSDAIASGPSYADTALPSVSAPLLPAALAVAEELYQLKDGAWSSRIRITWAAPDYPWVSHYRVRVLSGATVIHDATTPALEYLTGQVVEGQAYRIEAATVSRVGVESGPVVATLTPVGKLLPPTNVIGLDARVTAEGLQLTWQPAGDIDLKGYRLKVGADWASAVLLTEQAATGFNAGHLAPGAHRWLVRALDWSGNESAADAVVNITLVVHAAPAVDAGIIGANAQFSWSEPVSSYAFPVAAYEIRIGTSWAAGTSLPRIAGRSHVLPVSWSGARRFWVAAVDTAGTYGAPAMVELNVASPTAPAVQAEVIDNNVLLRWTDAAATLPLTHYEVRRGLAWGSATLVGTLTGRFSTIFETASGNFRYWVAGVDTAGTIGEPGSVAVTVSQPPDYVLNYDQDSTFSGTASGCLVQGGQLIPMVNTTETWAQHFTTRGWASPQDQVAAGFAHFIEPGFEAAYYEEVIDYGTTLASTRVSLTPTLAEIDGAVTVTPKISVSNTGPTGPWSDYPGAYTAYVANFRWLKLRLDFAGSGGDDIIVVEKLNIRMDYKIKSDSGMGTASNLDVGGTWVAFSATFVDVHSIGVTPQNTAPVFAVYDFTDSPDPAGFRVLIFDSAGNRINCPFSWTATGV
jgi:hypothetical protein